MNVSPASSLVAQPYGHHQRVHRAEKPANSSDSDAEKTDASRQQAHAKEKRLSDEETRIINELAARDREVRAHEQAHAAVGGVHAGAPSYTFERGPNGKNYAVGGEVPISTSPVAGDPEATIRKADQVKRAALAPAQPSAQDRAVAAQATQMKIDAQIELREQKAAELEEQLAQGELTADDSQAPELRRAETTPEKLSSSRRSIAERLITSELLAQNSPENPSFQALA